MDGYSLMKRWFAFAFENNSKVRPVHGALYGWFVELNNRKGWAAEFPAPATDCMQACGIHSYNTYKKALEQLIEWGFVEMRLASKNQYTANIIALSFIDEAPYKAIDKAMDAPYQKTSKHLQSTVQSTSQSTVQSTDSIIKQVNNKQETVNSVPTDGALLFEKFFLAYGKPIARNKAEHVWFEDLTSDEWHKAIAQVAPYLKQLDNPKYKKSPDRWLEEKCFNDNYGTMQDTVRVLNCVTGIQTDMPLADWNNVHANNSNTVYKLLAQ